MRDLNEAEMSAVAGGQTHSAATHTTIHVKPKNKSHYASLTAALDKDTPEIQEEPGDRGDEGGGSDGGGGDGGGGGGGGGDGGDTGDTSNGADAPPSDTQIDQMVAANAPVNFSRTCTGTSGKGSECVSGNAQGVLIVKSYDSKGDLISTTTCNPTSSWTVSLGASFLKDIRGGDGFLTVGKTPGYTCTTTGKG